MSTVRLSLEEWLHRSVRSGLLFGRLDEPLDDYGKRIVRAILVELESATSIDAVDPSVQPQERGERATPDRRDSSARPSPPARLGDAPRAELVELVEEFCGWWHLNREGNVNRTYDYIDKLVKQLRAAAGVGPAELER